MCLTIRHFTGIVMVSAESTGLFGGKYMDCTGFKKDKHALEIQRDKIESSQCHLNSPELGSGIKMGRN